MPKYMGYWCTGREDDLLAVVEVSEKTIAALEAYRQEFDQIKYAHPGVRSVGFGLIGTVRFFDQTFNGEEEAVESLYEAARENGFDDLAMCGGDGWFPIPVDTLPYRGDFRTDYEKVVVSEYGLYALGMGKYESTEFEADLGQLIEVLQGDAKDG